VSIKTNLAVLIDDRGVEHLSRLRAPNRSQRSGIFKVKRANVDREQSLKREIEPRDRHRANRPSVPPETGHQSSPCCAGRTIEPNPSARGDHEPDAAKRSDGGWTGRPAEHRGSLNAKRTSRRSTVAGLRKHRTSCQEQTIGAPMTARAKRRPAGSSHVQSVDRPAFVPPCNNETDKVAFRTSGTAGAWTASESHQNSRTASLSPKLGRLTSSARRRRRSRQKAKAVDACGKRHRCRGWSPCLTSNTAYASSPISAAERTERRHHLEAHQEPSQNAAPEQYRQ